MKGITEYVIRVILLCAILFIGVGLIVLGNMSESTAASASVARAVRHTYEVEVPVFHPRDPLSWDETIHMIGGWGCTSRGIAPYSILGANQCF